MHWWVSRLLFLPFMGPESVYEDLSFGWGLAFFCCALVFGYVIVVIEIKRWHDINYSGWWFLINFVPLIGFLVALFLCGGREGDAGTNRYGPPTTPNVKALTPD
ncbi:hypothetical protein EOS_33130 [Caballeronia mineralivorans PML1(12)]|uniref:DUF805 domain-containing protein n=1 Tax=Caballeronia mineralivorans PML1(12) TaxID=908627 RepID=A0A0J1CMH9_9BURK|nr:hypothetical protein EOS_33130 [Caballeronia mineralivorans PML1(12)]